MLRYSGCLQAENREDKFLSNASQSTKHTHESLRSKQIFPSGKQGHRYNESFEQIRYRTMTLNIVLSIERGKSVLCVPKESIILNVTYQSDKNCQHQILM